MTANQTSKTANQRLKEQSIEAILNAAGECYLEKSFTQTTVDEIAAKANVGRATVFRNFKTKETIFTEYIKRECRRITERLAKLLEQSASPQDYIVTLLHFVICESPKEPVYNISHKDSQSMAYTMDLDFFSLIGDELLEESLPRFYTQAKKNGQLRKHVTQEVMISWIKRLCISFVHNPIDQADSPAQVKKYLHALVVPSLFKDSSREDAE